MSEAERLSSVCFDAALSPPQTTVSPVMMSSRHNGIDSVLLRIGIGERHIMCICAGSNLQSLECYSL